MSAGIAAKRPIAVASSASAMPGATTASEVFFDVAIDWNEFMMPNTVPKRPMNGPAEATVASTRRFDSSRSTSRAIETSSTLSMRAWSPRNEPAACWKERFHSRMAATNNAAAPVFGWFDKDVYSSSSDWPDQKTCSKFSISLRNLRNRRALSKIIVQHQSEARKRPSITALTTIWADQNI